MTKKPDYYYSCHNLGLVFEIFDRNSKTPKKPIARIIFYYQDGKNWLLSGLYVNSKYRRRGLATKLINKGKGVAQTITLNCYKRPELISLYLQCGFSVTGPAPKAANEEQVYMEWHKDK